MERGISLFFHFIGFGLFITVQVAGFLLELKYKRSANLETKALLLGALKPIGLLSPVAVLIMLVTGIGNMTALGLGIFSMGWLTAKIIFFAIAVVSGLLFGIKSAKRGRLVQSMVRGEAPVNATELLESFDKQQSMFYVVMPVLLIIIVSLSVYGRIGGQ